MDHILEELYQVICARKDGAEEGSYTAYLFREGVDKILKKCGEECSEVIIAAKSLEAAALREPTPASLASAEEAREELKNEACDLIYHLMVLLAEREIPLEEVMDILAERSRKTGNLKKMKSVDKKS